MVFEKVITENVGEFDCGDKDLNEFFKQDAYNYHTALLGESYIIKKDGLNIAFCTLLNDKVGIGTFSDRTSFNRFRKRCFVNSKRLKAFPAIKIGRLAVDIKFNGKGFGFSLIDFVINLVQTNRYSGCRFITVDAYQKAIPFYEKYGFTKISELENSKGTCLMLYDLLSIK